MPEKDRNPSTWKRLRYSAEAGALAVFAAIIPRLSYRLLLALGGCLGTCAYLLLPHDRAVAYANLNIAFGDSMPPAQKRRIVRHTFRHFARAVLSMFWAKGKSQEQIMKRYDVENVELLRRIQERGKGVVVVSMHFGDWELGSLALGWLGAPMTIVAEPTRNPAIERRVTALRTLSGNRAVAPRFALIRMARTLQQGGVVGMLVDVNGRRNRGGVWLDFFGLPVFNGAAEAVMALRWGAPIIFAHVEHLPNGRGKIVFGPEVCCNGSGDFDADVKEVSQRCLTLCEELIKQHPEQWLWTYKRWKRRPTEEMGRYPFYSRHARV